MPTECEHLQEQRPIETLAERLAQVDALPLECDGLTRVISTLMQRDEIHHQVCVGTLTISNVGMIPIHWWIVLSDGRICNHRARMWSREEVQTWFQSQGISIAIGQ